MAKAYAEAREQQGASELLDEIVSAPPSVDPMRFQSPEQIAGEGMQRVREAVELLEQKASGDELEAYRRFVIDLAARVAAANKEGGVLGIGGERVSQPEQDALIEVAAALGTDPPQPGAQPG